MIESNIKNEYMGAVVKVTKHGNEALKQKLKQVTMMKDEKARPYENSTIVMRDFDSRTLSPPQRYVLAKQVLVLRELEWKLNEHGESLLNIDGYLDVTFVRQGEEFVVGVLPPIIEEQEFEIVPHRQDVICDGMHRCYLALTMRRKIKCVHISDIPLEFPYYAYPVEGGWNNLELLHGRPKGEFYIKKWHRTPDNKKLYRNFVPQFGNLSEPRGDLMKSGSTPI